MDFSLYRNDPVVFEVLFHEYKIYEQSLYILIRLQFNIHDSIQMFNTYLVDSIPLHILYIQSNIY